MLPVALLYVQLCTPLLAVYPINASQKMTARNVTIVETATSNQYHGRTHPALKMHKKISMVNSIVCNINVYTCCKSPGDFMTLWESITAITTASITPLKKKGTPIAMSTIFELLSVRDTEADRV